MNIVYGENKSPTSLNAPPGTAQASAPLLHSPTAMLTQTQEATHAPARPLKNLPARKRRKLATAPATLSVSELQGKVSPAPTERRVSRSTACAFCHRAQAPLFCALCSTPTCLICARHCTAAPPPPTSAPPTPRLSDSPTPPATPALVPRQLNSTIHFEKEREKDGARRRKREEPGEQGYEVVEEGGCGRTLCRGCCIENATHGDTCVECYRLTLTLPSCNA